MHNCCCERNISFWGINTQIEHENGQEYDLKIAG
jgi:hypothetical protein